MRIWNFKATFNGQFMRFLRPRTLETAQYLKLLYLLHFHVIFPFIKLYSLYLWICVYFHMILFILDSIKINKIEVHAIKIPMKNQTQNDFIMIQEKKFKQNIKQH